MDEEEKAEEKAIENEESEKIEDVKDIESPVKANTKWHEPSVLNHFRKFIRVIITTQDEATLFIMICDPNMPEFRINNLSAKKVNVYQKDAKDRAVPRTCRKAKTIKKKGEPNKVATFPVPFVWDDQTHNDKRLIIEIDGHKKEYDIDEIEEKKPLVIKKKKYYVEVKSTGYFREIQIRDKKSNKEKLDNTRFLRSLMVSSSNKRSELKASLDLRGIGISIVDKEPKEVMYLSIFKIKLNAKQESITKPNSVIETDEEYDIIIYHMQIDNMVSLENPILFTPETVLDKEKILNDPEHTPFIQIKLSYSSNQSGNVIRRRIDANQIMIQAMKVEVETGTLNLIMNTVFEVTGVFSDEQIEYLSAETVKQQKSQGVYDYKAKGVSVNEDEDLVEEDEEAKEATVILKKEEVCPELVTSTPTPPELSAINTDKLYFKLIHIGAIKMSITLSFEKRALNFDMNQGFGAITILYTLATSIANVSDAPLSFKELLITNIFQSQAQCTDMLTKNFVRQGMFQFYKLIGSSDLLGNPVGFVDKLGSGVFEFFNEPRKGLIKGPKEFVGGVGKGVTSLVTGVVSASFDSVSKISGSLYSVAKNVTGQETLPQKKSENALEGVYDGVLGGGKELVGGVTGVFTKPFEGAKREGAKGFLKGVGKGVLGLVASPLTAVLRTGHSVTQGITNTAIAIRKGKLPQHGRFRHPRYINARNILEPYDEDFAEANQILIRISNGKYSNHTIKFFADFPIYKRNRKTKDEGMLIVTEQTLLFCKDQKKLYYTTPLQQITDVTVYEGGVDAEDELKLYHLYVYSRKKKNYKFETVQYSLIDKTYSILSKEKASRAKVGNGKKVAEKKKI